MPIQSLVKDNKLTYILVIKQYFMYIYRGNFKHLLVTAFSWNVFFCFPPSIIIHYVF